MQLVVIAAHTACACGTIVALHRHPGGRYEWIPLYMELCGRMIGYRWHWYSTTHMEPAESLHAVLHLDVLRAIDGPSIDIDTLHVRSVDMETGRISRAPLDECARLSHTGPDAAFRVMVNASYPRLLRWWPWIWHTLHRWAYRV